MLSHASAKRYAVSPVQKLANISLWATSHVMKQVTE